MNLFKMIDEVRIIAMNGLEYASDDHDRRRYERLLELVASSYGQVLEMPAPAVRERLAAELGHVTPKVGAEGAIINGDGRILLTRRADDGKWGLPCGWVEPDESPYQAVIREVREETGLSVRPTSLVDAIHTPAGVSGAHAVVSILYLCEVIGGEAVPSPEEVLELRYWGAAEVPSWHGHHKELARVALAAHARVRREGDVC
jgi:8-oxo-dGTP pyrophosphatase MutT (NUDIX family)